MSSGEVGRAAYGPTWESSRAAEGASNRRLGRQRCHPCVLSSCGSSSPSTGGASPCSRSCQDGDSNPSAAKESQAARSGSSASGTSPKTGQTQGQTGGLACTTLEKCQPRTPKKPQVHDGQHCAAPGRHGGGPTAHVRQLVRPSAASANRRKSRHRSTAAS